MNTSTLNKMPGLIAEQSYKILALDSQIRDARELVAVFEAEIDEVIAFSDSFKNDLQRKVAKAQMMADKPQLADTLQVLRWLNEDRERQSVELALLQSRFAVAKLEARARIAKMESLLA